MEEQFSRRVRVREGEGRDGSKRRSLIREGEDVDTVVELFEEAADGDEAAGGGGGDGHGVDRVWRVVDDCIFGSGLIWWNIH